MNQGSAVSAARAAGHGHAAVRPRASTTSAVHAAEPSQPFHVALHSRGLATTSSSFDKHARRKSSKHEPPPMLPAGMSFCRQLDVEEAEAAEVEARRFGRRGRCEQLMWDTLKSHKFDVVMGVIIAMNSINIGVEQALRLNDRDTRIPDLLEHIFLVIYILEFLARVVVFGSACWKDAWVMFDFFVICTGVLLSWVLEPFVGSSGSFGPFLTIRILRLLRLTRMLRLLGRFEVLWMMVRGLLQCLNTTCYTLFLLLVMFYIFGVVSLELITNHDLAVDNIDGEFKDVVDVAFNSLPSAMLTMLQFVTFDNIVVVYRPLIEKDWTLSIFFIMGILIIGIILMNLVTAVIVQGALDQALQDQELQIAMEQARRKKLARDMRLVFARLDKDGSGCITKDEIGLIDDDDKALLKNLMDTSNPLEIFDALDVDSSGDLRIDEFVDGIWEVVVSNTPLHVKRMQRQIDVVFSEVRYLRRMQQRVFDLVSKMASVQPLAGTSSEVFSNMTSQPVSMWGADAPACPAFADRPPSPRIRTKSADTGSRSPCEKQLSPSQQSSNGVSQHEPSQLQKAAAPTPPAAHSADWEEAFVAELQQMCTTVMQRALGDACRSLCAEWLPPKAANGHTEDPEEGNGRRSSSREAGKRRPRQLSQLKVPKPKVASDLPSPECVGAELDPEPSKRQYPTQRRRPPSLVFDSLQTGQRLLDGIPETPT